MKEQPFEFNSPARQFRSMYWRHARFTKTIQSSKWTRAEREYQRGWSMCFPHWNHLSPQPQHSGKRERYIFPTANAWGYRGAAGLQVVSWICREESGTIFLSLLFSILGIAWIWRIQHSVGWGMHGASFPSKANAFPAGRPSEFMSSATHLWPLRTADSTVGSQELPFILGQLLRHQHELKGRFERWPQK